MKKMAEMEMTFSQFAQRANVTVADTCSTHLSLGKCVRMATALGVQVQDFIYRAPARARTAQLVALEDSLESQVTRAQVANG